MPNHKSLPTNEIKPATKAKTQEKQGTSKDAEKYRKHVRWCICVIPGLGAGLGSEAAGW